MIERMVWLGSLVRGALPLLLYLMAPARVHAQSVRVLTPDECVRIGLANNARLRAAGADVVAANAVHRQARAALLPQVRSEANFTRIASKIPNIEFTVPGTDSTFTFQGIAVNRVHSELRIEQPLLTSIRLRHESRAAADEADAVAADAEQERADVAFDIRRAYWDLRRALEVRSALNISRAQVDEHLTDIRNRFAAGTALRKDLLAAQTRRSEVRLDIVEADNAVRVAQLELNRLVGLPLDTQIQPTTSVEVDSTTVAVDRLTAEVLTGRPQLQSMREQVSALRGRLRAAQSERLPDLDVVSRFVYARPNPLFFSQEPRFNGTWELFLIARWDAWNGGRRAALTSEARARLEAAEARLADTRVQVSVDVAKQQLEVLRAIEAIDVAAQTVSEAEESFRVARQQFSEGVAVSGDVLDAEEALRRAQAQRAQSLADYAIARAGVLAVSGKVF